MRIAETLSKSVEEVMQLSVLEIRLWYEWFVLQHERNREAMNGSTAKNSGRRRR